MSDEPSLVDRWLAAAILEQLRRAGLRKETCIGTPTKSHFFDAKIDAYEVLQAKATPDPRLSDLVQHLFDPFYELQARERAKKKETSMRYYVKDNGEVEATYTQDGLVYTQTFQPLPAGKAAYATQLDAQRAAVRQVDAELARLNKLSSLLHTAIEEALKPSYSFGDRVGYVDPDIFKEVTVRGKKGVVLAVNKDNSGNGKHTYKVQWDEDGLTSVESKENLVKKA